MTKRELNFEGTSPLLYLVATPIGNLSEMTPRAIEVLKEMDYLSAEDSRNSGQLMAHFGINKPFISCHEHNEEEASSKIVSLLLSGKKVAYMSDAGYPTCSDPGERLVANCLEHGIKVSCLSGPNAALNALAASGLDSSHFYFQGFLSPKDKARKDELEELASRKETIIFYESPHRISKTINAMYEVLGNRRAVIARELTKSHEEFIRGTLEELAAIEEDTLRGEMVVVVEGCKTIQKEYSDEEILKMLQVEIKSGTSSKDAIRKISTDLDLPKKRVYAISLLLK
ncbi:MAG: 16S rRNA (cytidine(1402)-2'-O)-methyltransferase [Bacilli bacterium]|nr:16S rRNA (cytidine(1402)-2'-O)-methyltransferase [Bacilli bacterium]